MQNTLLMARKEFSGYFSSPIAYVFLITFLILTSVVFLFVQEFFLHGQASLRLFFEAMPWIYLILVPAITMRIWSEERREGTIELLMTLPLRPTEVILGKFFAAWAFISVALLGTLIVPIAVSRFGALDLGPVVGGYLGSFLLGGAYLAIGMCVSALSKNQILSFILTALVCLGFLAIGAPKLMEIIPKNWELLRTLAYGFGFVPHFENISRGVIDTRNLVYFGSLIFFFLLLNRYLVGSYRYV